MSEPYWAIKVMFIEDVDRWSWYIRSPEFSYDWRMRHRFSDRMSALAWRDHHRRSFKAVKLVKVGRVGK